MRNSKGIVADLMLVIEDVFDCYAVKTYIFAAELLTCDIPSEIVIVGSVDVVTFLVSHEKQQKRQRHCPLLKQDKDSTSDKWLKPKQTREENATK